MLYKIFDLKLPEDYIFSLNEEDTDTLLEESLTFIDGLEHQLDDLMWKNNSRFDEEGRVLIAEPSTYSYDPKIYQEEIINDPALEGKLLKAQDIKADIAAAYTVYGAAMIHKDEIINKTTKADVPTALDFEFPMDLDPQTGLSQGGAMW